MSACSYNIDYQPHSLLAILPTNLSLFIKATSVQQWNVQCVDNFDVELYSGATSNTLRSYQSYYVSTDVPKRIGSFFELKGKTEMYKWIFE